MVWENIWVAENIAEFMFLNKITLLIFQFPITDHDNYDIYGKYSPSLSTIYNHTIIINNKFYKWQ